MASPAMDWQNLTGALMFLLQGGQQLTNHPAAVKV